MKSISLFLMLSLFISSCSQYTWQPKLDENSIRNPSSQSVVFDDILSFKKSDQAGKDISGDVKAYVQNTFTGNMSAEFKLSTQLPTDVAFKVEMDVVDGKYLVRILHSADAFTHQQAAVGLCGFTDNFTNNTTEINTPLSIFEMYYNAKEKDVISMNNLLQLRQSFVETGLQSNFAIPQVELVEKVKKEAQDLQTQLAPSIKQFEKDRKNKKEARKLIIASLDKAAEDKQFKTIVARGDRKGVVELLKKYLPFEDMAPFEKRYWETYLEILQHPLPLDERILIYRGIDDDFIHSAVVAGETFNQEIAIKESKAFLMSTILVKNQGSWNRRLRSLETMQDKFIGTISGSDEFSRSSRITTMFKNHSDDPKGSPFLSFSPSIEVATRFGHKKNSAYLVDPRLLQFNFTSEYQTEKEFLTALVTFPDELVGIWSSDLHSNITPSAFFKQKLEELVINKFGKADKDKILSLIDKNTNDYFSPVFKVSENNKKVKSSFMDYFKIFATKKSEPAPTVDIKGNLNCQDIIKAFWIK